MFETLNVANRCNFSLSEIKYEYPEELVPAGETPATHLRKLTEEGARLRYPKGVPAKVRKLIDYELQLIAELRYDSFFLTIEDIVRYARSKDILCQGRGSAANSAVCYVLGITSIDPVRSGLLFERFVSAERREPPDIDVDFEAERREEVIQWVYARYGRDRAAICSTPDTTGPGTPAPVEDVPGRDAEGSDTPAPTADAPTADAPNTDAPNADAPNADAPKAAGPDAD
ncbi:MAG: polymerase, partial [Citricoccus sp.]|nr:polymerase [Citricoccus sp. WCRC_4]